MNMLLTLAALAGSPGDLAAPVLGAAQDQEAAPVRSEVNGTKFPDDYQTVLSLVKAAGLEKAIAGMDGQFTLFAPSDAAFAALPEALLADLGKPENADTLKAILLYHVVPARVPSSAAVKATSAPTVEGTELTLALRGDALYVDQAQVIATDLEFAGGIVHGVDAVLVPAEVAATLAKPKAPVAGCGTAFSLVELAGLTDALKGMDGFTLFAPTDEAFAALPEETVALLLAPENRGSLKKVLLNHVVGATVKSPAAIGLARKGGEKGTPVEMLQGKAWLKATDAGLTIGGANIVRVDESFANGVVHVIDAVIVPAGLELKPINPDRVQLQEWMDKGKGLWKSGDWDGAAKVWRSALEWGVQGDRMPAQARMNANAALAQAKAQSGKAAAKTLKSALQRALDSYEG